MNGVYLGQVFKKETGNTFLKYVTNYRMEEAETSFRRGNTECCPGRGTDGI